MIDCWKWFGSEHKIHCDSLAERNFVLGEVPGSRQGGEYLIPSQNKEFDVIIPSKLRDAAVRVIEKHRAKNTKSAPKGAQRVTGAVVS